jgi:hypothetical protein
MTAVRMPAAVLNRRYSAASAVVRYAGRTAADAVGRAAEPIVLAVVKPTTNY